jgi:Transposase
MRGTAVLWMGDRRFRTALAERPGGAAQATASPSQESRLTNARTEGFNGNAKLVIRRADGYKSFPKVQNAAPKLLRLNNFSRAPTAE